MQHQPTRPMRNHPEPIILSSEIFQSSVWTSVSSSKCKKELFKKRVKKKQKNKLKFTVSQTTATEADGFHPVGVTTVAGDVLFPPPRISQHVHTRSRRLRFSHGDDLTDTLLTQVKSVSTFGLQLSYFHSSMHEKRDVESDPHPAVSSSLRLNIPGVASRRGGKAPSCTYLHEKTVIACGGRCGVTVSQISGGDVVGQCSYCQCQQCENVGGRHG